MRMNGYRCDICKRESVDGEVWHFVQPHKIGNTMLSTEPSTTLEGVGHLCSPNCVLKYAENFAGVLA